MKNILSIIVLCFACEAIFATEQHPDRILVKGDTLLLYSRPFEKADSVRRMALHKRLRETSAECAVAPRCDYCGLWRLDKDTLRLEAIYDQHFKTEVPGEDIFEKGEAATWFSGDLRAVYPEEKTVYYQPDGFQHYYKNETRYTIRNGVRKSTKNYSNRMIGDKKVFDEQTISSISKSFVFPQLTDSTVYKSVFVAFSATPDKQGKIRAFDLVKMALQKQDGTKEIVTDVFHPYLRELLRRLEAAEPYSMTIDGKVQAITLGLTLKAAKDTKKRPQ